MNSYEISSETLAIIPKNENISIVYEINNTYIINLSVDKILDNSCKFFGSSFNGRKIGSSELLKINYKVPIIIEDSNNIIFFPTSSNRNSNYSWISLNNIIRYEKNLRGCKIYFRCGKSIIFPISYNIIDNQINRSIRLHYLINKRKYEKITKNY